MHRSVFHGGSGGVPTLSGRDILGLVGGVVILLFNKPWARLLARIQWQNTPLEESTTPLEVVETNMRRAVIVIGLLWLAIGAGGVAAGLVN